MKSFTYKKYDVFISNQTGSFASAGNSSACFFVSSDVFLSSSDMLKIAREHKGYASGVVFCQYIMGLSDIELHAQEPFVKLTYYSPECEIDFCGHSTVACMHALVASIPQLANLDSFVFSTNKKGVLICENKIEKDHAIYISAPPVTEMLLPSGLILDEKVDTLNLASYLNCYISDFDNRYPVALVNGGLRTLIVPILDYDRLIDIQPDSVELKGFCVRNGIDIIMLFSPRAANREAIAHTRVFSPKYGYLEDAATGSGSCALAHYLLKHHLWFGQPGYFEQGQRGINYNQVFVNLKDDLLVFGGSTKLRVEGRYFI